MTSTPHDALFKATFSVPQRAAELLQQLLGPELVEAIDWASLTPLTASYVDEELKEMHADLMFAARMHGRDVRLYVLLEHKSRAERWTAFWLLRYMTNAWARLLDTAKDIRLLPPIVPVVVYHDDRSWSAETEFSRLVELGDDDEFKAFTPRYRFVLADLGTFDGQVLRTAKGSAEVRLALLALKEARSAANLAQMLAGWAGLFSELDRDAPGRRAIRRIFSYVLAVRDSRDFEGLDVRRLGLGKTIEAIMETREAYLLRVGREEGRLEGRQTGREEGRLDALRSMFVAQLRSKFSDVPAGVVARVEKADVERLGRWSLRIVVAATLDEVFAE